MENNIEIISNVLKNCKLDQFCEQNMLEKFDILSQQLVLMNKKFNLTAIVEQHDIAQKHIADSLFAAELIATGKSVIDIGAGGGFPTLPLAIAFSEKGKTNTFTALDSTAKKLVFISESAALLGLKNVKTIVGRAEELSVVASTTAAKPQLRESFDIAIARGVADMPLLCELCLPFVRVGGSFIAMKGVRGEQECTASAQAIRTLGGKVSKIHYTSLPGIDGESIIRTIIIVHKVNSTPVQYPRAWRQILKKPL